MSAAVKSYDPSMTGPVLASTVFHIVLFVLTAVGLPFVAKDTLIISTPISVELVTIDEITQTNRVAPPKKEEKPEKEPEKLAPPPMDKPPPPPKMTAEAPPDMTAPKLPEPKDKNAEPEKPLPPPPKPADKPKPKPKEPEKPKKVEAAKPKEDPFASLLKNLTPDADASAQQKPQETAKDTPSAAGQIARLGDQLTISELDAVKRQIGPCWNVQTGSKYAENLAVEVRVFINRDGSIQEARVLDTGRYNRDAAFRAAAESALRALRNPRCTPLKLPPEKYEQWKVTVINFDPREML